MRIKAALFGVVLAVPGIGPAAEAKPSTPQELAAMLDKEDRTVVPLIKKLGIKPE